MISLNFADLTGTHVTYVAVKHKNKTEKIRLASGYLLMEPACRGGLSGSTDENPVLK